MAECNGVVSEIIDIINWDDVGDADCFMENGRIINSRDMLIENILLGRETV